MRTEVESPRGCRGRAHADRATERDRFNQQDTRDRHGPTAVEGASLATIGFRWDVKHNGGRSLVQQSLDKLRERVRILEASARVEAGDAQESSVALHAPIYPPRPYVLTLSAPSDLDSRHAPLLPFGSVQRQD
jgi:hypothetical protein